MGFRHLWTEDEAARRALIPTLAPWIHEASCPFADWYFATPELAVEILREWMQRPTAEVFVGRAIVMMEPEMGEAVGCLIALSGADLAASRSADFLAFCRELGTGPDVDDVLSELVPASRELFPDVGDDELYISRVAIDPARRGKGLGRELVAHALETFRARGFRRFRLDVSAGNPAAIRSYEAVGLRVIGSQNSPAAGLTYCTMVL